MARSRSSSKAHVQKELDSVAAKLSDQKARGAKRLALLRRQAELGDQRDDAVIKARRAAAPER